MYRYQRNYSLYIVIAVHLCCSKVFAAVEFEPGVGAGVEYTNNATLVPDNEVDDLIALTYVGAIISESEGTLKYDASTSFNKNNYTQGTYEDQRYFNLGATADWEMIKNRFNWTLTEKYSQIPVLSLNSNTPNNIQDSNVFTFGANIRVPFSARQNFSLVPTFSQYYYEVLNTDNKQYALSASWNYQASRLTNVGLNFSVREIDYTETNLFGQSIEGTTFTSLGFTFNGERLRSGFSGSLGATNVERDNGDATTGFSGFLNWFTDMSSLSRFSASVSTGLTDTSTVAASGSASGVQVTTDVVRNSIFSLAYLREDASLNTRISMDYSKLEYSENPLDRAVQSFGVDLSYPVTPLLSSGAYMTYRYTEQLGIARIDGRYTIGSNLRYKFSRKLRGLFDLKYREKESNFALENYSEFSVFASIAYGFGDVRRPSRIGGY